MPQDNPDADNLIVGAATDAGMTGKNNEDAFDIFQADWQDGPDLRRVHVALVCDGIGGNNAGEVASKVAVETIRGVMTGEPETPLPERMEKAVQAANLEVSKAAQENPVLRGMGTTVVMAAIAGDTLYVVHAGDSRAYLVRNGTAGRLTLDHTWAQEAIDHGVLTPEAARVHPNRNVIKRFLGIDETVVVDHGIIDISRPPTAAEGTGRWTMLERMTLLPGDTILVCSDGLTDEISDEELQTAVRKYPPQEAADRLVALANDHGGRDNITVALLQLPGAAPVAVAAAGAASVPTRTGSRLTLIIGALVVLAILAIVAGLALRSGGGNNASSNATGAAGIAPATTLPLQEAATGTPSPTSLAANTDTPTPAAAAVTAEASDGQLSGAGGPVATTGALATLPAAAGDATSTPIPTHTPTPTATRPPVAPSATPTGAAPTPAATASPAEEVQVDLLLPVNGVSGAGNVPFQWRLSSGELADNQEFELRFWKPDSDPIADGFSPTGSTTALVQRVNLTETAADPQLPFAPGEYLWGIVLVEQNPYRPLALVSPAWRFTYQEPTGAEPADCIGIGCGRP